MLVVVFAPVLFIVVFPICVSVFCAFVYLCFLLHAVAGETGTAPRRTITSLYSFVVVLHVIVCSPLFVCS